MIVPLVGLGMLGVLGYTGLEFFLKTNKLIRLSPNKSHLELPVYSYKHPTTGKKVKLLGVIHVADESYFANIQEMLDLYGSQQDSSRILYEMVDKVSDEDEGSFSDDEKAAYKSLKEFGPAMKKLADYMGLAYQKDQLTYKDEWINTDMNMADVVRAAVKRDIDIPDSTMFSEKIDELIAQDQNGSARVAMQSVIKFLPLIMGAQKLISKLLRRETFMESVILNDRNEIAFEAIKCHLEDVDNVISVWGVGHVPGLEQMLFDDGFVKTSETWLAAVTLR